MKKIGSVLAVLLVLTLGLISSLNAQTTAKAICSQCHKHPVFKDKQCKNCYMQIKMGATEGICSVCKKKKLLSPKGKAKGMCFQCYENSGSTNETSEKTTKTNNAKEKQSVNTNTVSAEEREKQNKTIDDIEKQMNDDLFNPDGPKMKEVKGKLVECLDADGLQANILINGKEESFPQPDEPIKGVNIFTDECKAYVNKMLKISYEEKTTKDLDNKTTSKVKLIRKVEVIQ